MKKMDKYLEGIKPVDYPEITIEVLTGGKARRHSLYMVNHTRLLQMAQRICDRQTQDTHCVICINVDDPLWRPLVEHLMPDNEPAWQGFRDKGMTPCARGIVEVPGIRATLEAMTDIQWPTDRALKNDVWCVVLAAEGASVYTINQDYSI